MTRILIDENKCLKDGICSEVCPCRIFVADERGLAHIDPEMEPACVGCGHCISVCPASAISLEGVTSDQLEKVPEPLVEFSAFSSLIKARRSIRSFKQEAIPEEEIIKIVDVARWAPTAKNSQAHSWLLITGHEKVNRLSEAVIESFRSQPRMAGMVASFESGYDVIHRGAPHLLIAYGPEKYGWGSFDAAIAISTIELAARAAGFGSCWGGFTTKAAAADKSIAKSLGIADEDTVYGVLMLGRPNFKYRRVPQRRELRLKILA